MTNHPIAQASTFSVLLILCVSALQVTSVAQDLAWPQPVANHVIPVQSTPITHGPTLYIVTSEAFTNY